MRYLTAGESHGEAITGILEGVPANLEINPKDINRELTRRQGGYGRGGRMKIENDLIDILSGIRGGKTLGSPITLQIKNDDWENWREVLAPFGDCGYDQDEVKIKKEDKIKRVEPKVTKPRPGHADLAGALKYNQDDLRNILERASARETAIRVAIGAIAKVLLKELGIEVTSHVIQLGSVALEGYQTDFDKIKTKSAQSQVRCVDEDVTKKMIAEIDDCKEKGDSLGGIFEIRTTKLPVGLGGHVQWDRKLDGQLAQVLMSIQAIKGVEVGLGFEAAKQPGSQVHDPIFYDEQFFRESNNAGGIEGGMSNGEPVVIKAAMKPIPTLYQPLSSVDLETKEEFKASVERSDVTAVPAASVVGESVVAFELAKACLEKFGGDSIEEIKDNYNNYLEMLEQR
ncbi:chorismate synthase [Halobacteroides halobius DSM 5150]|uniref:Chorismate synthase n=1 Tax=Halobacteroides halobius (strain ATCC 35273 / DSM 5150 / MD-1) TaxID=748449 RepID=L0K7H6_HALHC|nr:chorismate synthase [Halobacteroides halobius]AGB40500.1 chorismate synthase [Halobacteroides halobius DSM 5150]